MENARKDSRLDALEKQSPDNILISDLPSRTVREQIYAVLNCYNCGNLLQQP